MFRNNFAYIMRSDQHWPKLIFPCFFLDQIFFREVKPAKMKANENLLFQWCNNLGVIANYVFFHIFQNSLRKQPTFSNAFTGFPAKWHLRNKCRNSILICCVITQIWVVLLISWKLLHPIRTAVVLHQYGISALVSQTSFHGKTGAGMVKCNTLAVS